MEDNKKHMHNRIYVVYVVFLLFAIAIVAKIVDVMFFERDYLISISKKQSIRVVNVNAIRGNIYSADSCLIATSIPLFTIRMDLHPSVTSNDTFRRYIRPLSDSLARIFPQKSAQAYYNELTAARKKGKRTFLIKKNITYAQLQRIQTFPILKKGQFKGGLIIEEFESRAMPYKELSKRTIGYYNANSKVAVGIEGAYNSDLAGISGQRLMEKIANGVWKPVRNGNESEPENGKDIVTTIDMRVQDVAESALQKCLEENEAEFGCAILMEVSTGEIRAIANLQKTANGYKEQRNIAIGESVEPGSTFKTISMMAILEQGVCDTGMMVPTGIRQIADRRMIDSKREGYGQISLKHAFEVSSNVGISYAAMMSFENKQAAFTDFFYRNKLNEPQNIELKGEGRPYIKNTKDKTWSKKISLPWMSIGYETKMTPLQILTFYNAIANNGCMVKPMFVKEVRRAGDMVEKKEPTVMVKQICSSKTLALMQDLLEGVVQNGTAKSLKKSPYKVAGKTGTAQDGYKEVKQGKQVKMRYRASFAGYFPADDPRYSCMVMVFNPQKGRQYGGEVAAPVFKEIADKVYATLLQMDIETPDAHDSVMQVPYIAAGNDNDFRSIYKYLGVSYSSEDGGMVRQGQDAGNYVAISGNKNIVPNVRGMGARDAVYLLESLGMKVGISGKGKVFQQSILPGTSIVRGQYIQLSLS